MIKEERWSKILEMVNEQNFVSFHDLMTLTDSSESTIRADLTELDKLGRLIRRRGGAEKIIKDNVSFELSNESKIGLEIQAKMDIAANAAKLIKDNNLIYVDAGTTTLHLFKYITSKNISIVTNSLSIAREAKLKGHKVYVTGGDIKLNTDAFVGSLTVDIINRFTFDLGFFGTNGIDIKGGLTTPDVEEAIIKQTAMIRCKKTFVLADHTKFDIKTAVTFHPFVGEEIITDYITNNIYLNKGIMEVKQ